MALVPEFLSGDLTSPKVRVSFQDGVCKKKKKEYTLYSFYEQHIMNMQIVKELNEKYRICRITQSISRNQIQQPCFFF